MGNNSSYNYWCNPQHFCEDPEDDPTWLGFDWTFRDSNEVRLLHKIKAFEKLHPNLTVMWADQFNTKKYVFSGPVLFHADGKEYREIKYSYKIYGINIQYQPSDLLYQWLLNWDEISEQRKHKERCIGCKYKGKGLMCNLGKRWKECFTPRI